MPSPSLTPCPNPALCGVVYGHEPGTICRATQARDAQRGSQTARVITATTPRDTSGAKNLEMAISAARRAFGHDDVEIIDVEEHWDQDDWNEAKGGDSDETKYFDARLADVNGEPAVRMTFSDFGKSSPEFFDMDDSELTADAAAEKLGILRHDDKFVPTHTRTSSMRGVLPMPGTPMRSLGESRVRGSKLFITEDGAHYIVAPEGVEERQIPAPVTDADRAQAEAGLDYALGEVLANSAESLLGLDYRDRTAADFDDKSASS